MSDTIPGIAPSPVSAVDLDAIEEWARGSTIMAARARIPAIVRELREAREELARLRERDAASATDDPLSSIKTMQIALRARPLDHDTLALLLVLKGAREEIERLRALLPPFVAAHNPDRAQIALLGALAADQVKTEQVKRDPDPTAPGAPGERVERRG